MLSVRALCVAAVVVALAVTHAAAWGNVGHQVTAAVAQNLLSKRANDAVTKILDGQTMETVSTWADDVKHTSQYAWSAPLHYVDAQDKMCNFDFTRDCWDHEMTPETSPNACVAGAITNYTKRASASLRALMSNRITHHHTQRVNGQKVQGDDETSREQLANAASVNEALKFLIHFLGDIHQPLHVAFAGDRGGNEITVYFYGYKENLHAVWDEWIISRLLTDFFGGSQNSWTAALTNQIQNGNFSDAAKQWAQCNDGSTACTTGFANESITYACNSAYECIPGSDTPCDTQRVVDGSRLDDDYFYNTYPVVHQRIAQGGVRLAALLNNLFG